MLRYARHMALLAIVLAAVLVLLARASVQAQTTDSFPTEQWYAQFWENTTLSGPAFSTGFAPVSYTHLGLD